MHRHLLLAVALLAAPAAAPAQSFYTSNNTGTDRASPNSWTPSTGTGAVPTLQGGQGIRFNGGGTVELRGATAGTAFTLPALSAGTGDATVLVVQPSGATAPTTASGPGLVRADPAATVFFATPG